MPGLDFTGLQKRSAADSATEPRRVFSALPGKHAKYAYPRDVQSEVWEKWHPRRGESDLVIKMNTGGGKTVVGLVILKSCINEGAGPAAYITADAYLAEQVASEAAAIGIETTDDPRSSRFQTGKAILVANIYKLVNGKSVFGVKGDARPGVEIGTVLIDDAHACVNVVEEQFSLKVGATHAAYKKLLALFSEDMQIQSPSALRDLEAQDPSVSVRVPYWAWIDKQDQVLGILHPHRHEDGFEFTWPLISDCLPLCMVAATVHEFEVKPHCVPINRIKGFARAKRKIYLTATLADDSVLVTHFDAASESAASPISPSTADDLGDRMILMPLESHPGASDDQVQQLLVEQSRRHNVVVIVPSRRRATYWQPFASAIHDSKTIREGVAQLRSGHVGLVVLVNKYDGIDLPDDACRILVLDGLPEAYGALDRLEALALDESDAMVTRQIQRIEQGMGRGVRSNNDYCVVMLLGARLTQRIHRAGAQEKFSPATRAQLELSRKVAEMLHGRPLGELADVIEQCLGRDSAWVAAARDVLDGITYEAGRVSPAAASERGAFDLAESHRYLEARQELDATIGSVSDRQVRGWLKQEAANYLHFVDPVGAQRLQASAHNDNRSLLRPRDGILYSRLDATLNQAQCASAELARLYPSGNELVVGFSSILDDLVPDADPNRVNAFEQAVHDLGVHLGFLAQRPERDLGEGPDVLWSLGELHYLVIECKSASTSTAISKRDAAQLSHSIDWFLKSYDKSCGATALLIHPSQTPDNAAVMRAGSKVTTFERLAEFRAQIRKFSESLAANQAYRDPRALAEQLNSRGLNGPAFVGKWTVAPKQRR